MKRLLLMLAISTMLLSASPILATVVLQDDFSGATLDAAKWTAVDSMGLITVLPEGLVTVGANGADRCYLVSADQWDTTQGTLTVTGKFQFVDLGYPTFEVWLRAANGYDSQLLPNGTGTLSSGVITTLWESSMAWEIPHVATALKTDAVWPPAYVGTGMCFPADATGEPATGDGQIDWSSHTMYDFVAIDNGTTVTVTITDQLNTLFTATSSAGTTFSSGAYHVGFGGSGAALDEVTFDYVANGTVWSPGDANKDGKVDGSDVTILAGNWQVLENATWAMGDFNADGKVDGSDVTILAGNWQAGVTTAAASVPEPSTIALLLSLIAGLFLLRRKN